MDKREKYLKYIPTAGRDIPLLSYFGTFCLLFDAKKFIKTGIQKWPNNIFKIPALLEWVVVVAHPTLRYELHRAPETVLSSALALEKSLQAEYTIGQNIITDPYHVPIIRSELTKALPQLVPMMHEEVVEALNEYIPLEDDWTCVSKTFEIMAQVICRASNRAFVGRPLCRDPDYVDLNVQFTVDVVQTAAILGAVPRILRPLVNSLVSNIPKRMQRAKAHLAPVIQARRKEREEKEDQVDKTADVLTWLMDEAKGKEASDLLLTTRMLTINFAAIHTSSTTLMHAFYNLVAYPEYIQALREEVEEVANEEGWTKAGLDKMHKVDSFIKESQRLHPVGGLSLQRVAISDYTFSDGTTVPQGTTLTVAVQHAHLNGTVYENPTTFDGFRFLKMKERETKKFDLVSTSGDSLSFGYGRHACPGRYFATCELKLILAHLLVTYDIKFENDGVRPADTWVSLGGLLSCVPNANAKVLFRRRILQ
ncbi:cytochrome P450 [Flammula alnicola]|nr:cytochrome P450 [Flammula alnicola]